MRLTGLSCVKICARALALLTLAGLSNPARAQTHPFDAGQQPQEQQAPSTSPPPSAAAPLTATSKDGLPPLRLTFQAALELARKNSAQFQAAVTNAGLLREDRVQARALLLPSVLQDMIGDLTSQPEPVVIKLFSEDAKLLEGTAPKVAEAIGKIHGVVDVLSGIENTISGPAVTYQVNPSVATHAGFTTEEVALDASAILEGEPAALPVILNDRPYTIRVRFPEANRSSLERMNNTLVASSAGHTATLGSLASVEEEAGQTEIRRENLQRLVEVTGRFEGVDLGTGISAVQKTISDMHLHSSIRVEYGGIYQEQQKSFHDLLTVLFVALLLLFVVLLFEFRTFSAPIAILASALLSTFGGFLALLITGTTFNVASFMGMIIVIGIVAKNGILLLDAEHHFRDLGFSAQDAMIQSGRRRLRPIIMAALATIAGMPPLAFAIGAADAATVGYRGGRRTAELDGPVAGVHASDRLLPCSQRAQTRCCKAPILTARFAFRPASLLTLEMAQ